MSTTSSRKTTGTKQTRRKSPKRPSPNSGTIPPEKRALFKELAHRLPDLSNEELAELLTDLKPLRADDVTPAEESAAATRAQQILRAPRNDDELWELIRQETGYEIPRVAVCHDHCAPFDPISDAYFNRESALLIMAARESGKTLTVAVLHYINAETKPGIEGVTFGAIKPQAQQAYKYVKSFVYTRDASGNRIPKPQIDGDPTQSKTEWKTGSLIAIIVGTEAGVNSPHPQTVHADEVDLMKPEVLAESRNMSSSRTLPGGKRIPATDIITSTRKSTRGPMQVLLNEVDEAKKNGHRPPWKVYAFCFKEAAAEVPCCRVVDPIARVRRLIHLSRNPNELCDCDQIVKGEWDENHPRTLESVCRGDLFKSRGWMHYDDIARKFTQNSQAVWEAQMECRRPMADGLYLPTFSRPRHCVRGWIPRPQYGRISMGVDWGGAALSVVLWIQGPLLHPIEVVGFTMKPLMVPQGAYVVFDSIFAPPIGATKLANQVVAKEIAYRQRFDGWRVRGRFPDQAGRQQINDWHEHSPPLRTHWYITRDFDPTVETLQSLMTDNQLYICVDGAPELADDFEGWRMKNGKEVHDDSSHGPAAARYGLGNVVVVERRREREQGKREAMPAVRERGVDAVDRAGLMGAVGSASQGIESENWRKTIGMLTTNVGSESWQP